MSATVAEIVWYQEDSATPLTVSKPASFGPGQMLVMAFIQHNNPSAQTDLTAPAGWSTAGALDGGTADGKVFYYTYTGSDPASWDFPYRSTADVIGGLLRVTGADITTPAVVAATTPTTSVTSPMDSPSVTPTGADDLLLALISDICNGTILAATVPAGMTDLGLGEVSGHFMSTRAAYQQLSSGSATGPLTWTSVSPTGLTGGTWTIAIKSAAGVTSSTTPEPLVISGASRPAPPAAPILLRSTLQDPPVLTTPGPLVITGSRPVIIPRPLLLRSTLTDPPQLTTPPPYVVTGPVRPNPGGITLIRSSLVDTAVVTGVATPGPYIVGPGSKYAPIPPVLLFRSTLTDPVRETTPGPIVITQTARPAPAQLLMLRSSLADPAPPAAATPGPLLVTTTTALAPGRVTLIRSALVTAVAVLANPAQPYIVTSQPARARTGVLLLVGTVTATGCDCLVHRPNTGTVSRPGSGTTSRPYTGIVSRPCTC